MKNGKREREGGNKLILHLLLLFLDRKLVLIEHEIGDCQGHTASSEAESCEKKSVCGRGLKMSL